MRPHTYPQGNCPVSRQARQKPSSNVVIQGKIKCCACSTRPAVVCRSVLENGSKMSPSPNAIRPSRTSLPFFDNLQHNANEDPCAARAARKGAQRQCPLPFSHTPGFSLSGCFSSWVLGTLLGPFATRAFTASTKNTCIVRPGWVHSLASYLEKGFISLNGSLAGWGYPSVWQKRRIIHDLLDASPSSFSFASATEIEPDGS
ncbi:hypothetical protein BGZ63DRAFT_103614 [Mariannaea sp. PMI_226]|nr:hypothetical protein BGZ63DRAFT_103614 [Mariannaea sp. PMI_226]